MNLQGPVTTVVAIACILAVGVASTSLDAVETEPSDVMDTSFIPTEENQPEAEGDGGGGGGSAKRTPSEGGETDAGTEQTEGTPKESKGGGGGGGSESLQVTFWNRLWATIMNNLVYILGTLGALVAAGLGYVVYRRRFADGAGPGAADIHYDVDTSNDVYESWWEMVELTEVEEPMTKTPQEFAEEAIEMGYDPDAVSELTRLFEETLYGGKEVTREEERGAKEAIERIKSKGREAV